MAASVPASSALWPRSAESESSIDVSRPHAPRGGQGRPDAGNDKVRINSSSLDHPLVILADHTVTVSRRKNAARADH
jgi:hypothetical protein